MSIRPFAITTPAPAAAASGARATPLVTGALAAGAALVVNVALFLAAAAAGTETVLQAPGGPRVAILLPSVALMTVLPIAIGTAVLVVLSKVRPGSVRQLAWIGLVIGVGTVVMPLTFQGGADVKAVLATMHVVTGVAWLVSVLRSTR